MKIRKTCVRYTGEDICVICMAPLASKKGNRFVTKLACNHMYHPKCIAQWHKSKLNGGTCPTCRRVVFFNVWHAVKDGRHFHLKDASDRIGPLCRNPVYNIRYRRSYYNVVLFELRKFQSFRERFGGLSFAETLKYASDKVKFLLQEPQSYFSS